jgi:hypothetical protein
MFRCPGAVPVRVTRSAAGRRAAPGGWTVRWPGRVCDVGSCSSVGWSRAIAGGRAVRAGQVPGSAWAARCSATRVPHRPGAPRLGAGRLRIPPGEWAVRRRVSDVGSCSSGGQSRAIGGRAVRARQVPGPGGRPFDDLLPECRTNPGHQIQEQAARGLHRPAGQHGDGAAYLRAKQAAPPTATVADIIPGSA